MEKFVLTPRQRLIRVVNRVKMHTWSRLPYRVKRAVSRPLFRAGLACVRKSLDHRRAPTRRHRLNRVGETLLRLSSWLMRVG